MSPRALSMTAAAAFVAFAAWASTPSPRPIVEIPKAIYVHGEQVFFWVGVETDAPMERESYQPCTWTIVDPRGGSQSHALGWPTDGDGRYGWKGGAGVAADATVPGSYSVTVSCGAETVEASFKIQEFRPLQQVEASVRASGSCEGRPRDQTLRLEVRNASPQEVVVSAPGSLSLVSFSASTLHPPASCDGFFPAEAMGLTTLQAGDTLYFDLTPDVVDHVPHVSLEPGESHAWTFCLSSGLEYSSCPFDGLPDQIRVHAVLQLLFRGSSPQGSMGPIRLPVRADLDFGE